MREKIPYLITALLVCSSSCNKDSTFQSTLRPVKIAKVEQLSSTSQSYTGIVESQQSAVLAFRMSGTMSETPVGPGAMVKKGDLVAAIDPFDYNLQLNAAKSAFQTAQYQLQRNQRLLKEQAISKQEFEISQTNYAEAEANYKAAQELVRDTRLYAPFDGFIEKKYVNNYQKIGSGDAIVNLVDPYLIQVKVILPEMAINWINRPMDIYLEFDTEPGIQYRGEILSRIDASIEGGDIPVKLGIKEQNFNPLQHNIHTGFSCKALFIVSNTDMGGVSIPLSSICYSATDRKPFVWTINEKGEIKSQSIEIYQVHNNQNVIVSAGLSGNETIVTAGAQNLIDGQRVSIIR